VEGIAFRYFEIEHGGKPNAVNKGLQESNGDYITVLDADDQLPPSSVSSRLKPMLKNSADLCIGSFETQYRENFQMLRSVKGLIHKSRDQLIRVLIGNVISPFHQNAMLFHRDLVERTGMMDPAMVRGQDKDYAICLIKHADQIVFVEDSVYIYNRYDRPFKKRISNRCTGMKYHLKVAGDHLSVWRKVVYFPWILLVEFAKLIHDLFGIYKK